MEKHSKQLVRVILEENGFKVEEIPRAKKRTADFLVSDARSSYLVEVTERNPAQDFVDFARKLKLDGYASLVRTITRSDRIDGIVRDKAKQLRQTAVASDYRILWITTIDDDTKYISEILLHTLYGFARLSGVRNLDSLTEMPCTYDCFYYDHFSFYRHDDLDGVAFSSLSRVCLFLNPLSRTAASFRKSKLAEEFSSRHSLLDPEDSQFQNALFLELDVDRKNDHAKWLALKTKYGIYTSRMTDSTFD